MYNSEPHSFIWPFHTQITYMYKKALLALLQYFSVFEAWLPLSCFCRDLTCIWHNHQWHHFIMTDSNWMYESTGLTGKIKSTFSINQTSQINVVLISVGLVYPNCVWNDVTASNHHTAPQSACTCICKCCLRRHAGHSINKWCTISSTWKHSASETSTRAVLSQDVKVLSVTGSCSRVTCMQEASSLQSAPTINSCENTAVYMGTGQRREHSHSDWSAGLSGNWAQTYTTGTRVCADSRRAFFITNIFTSRSEKDLL